VETRCPGSSRASCRGRFSSKRTRRSAPGGSVTPRAGGPRGARASPAGGSRVSARVSP
jgi:hypothetical protein